MNTYKIKVNRKLTPQKILDKTGWTQYTDKDVVNSMPQLKGNTVEIEFFKLDRYVTCEELEKEFESRGLVADPYVFLSMGNEIADEKKYIGTQWKDKDGKYCFVSFHRWRDERDVDVRQYVSRWDARWWFAGVRLDNKTMPLELPNELTINGIIYIKK